MVVKMVTNSCREVETSWLVLTTAVVLGGVEDAALAGVVDAAPAAEVRVVVGLSLLFPPLLDC